MKALSSNVLHLTFETIQTELTLTRIGSLQISATAPWFRKDTNTTNAEQNLTREHTAVYVFRPSR